MLRCTIALLVWLVLYQPTEAAVAPVDESKPMATAALAIAKAAPYRSSGGSLAFRIDLAGKADPARIRIMLDVDGPERGAPSSGADFMVEGVSFYKYPKEAKGWNWVKMTPPLVLAKENILTCVLPQTFHVESARWYVETTDTNWATIDRFPKAGFADFRFADLPLLAAGELTRNVGSPSLQIMDVTPFRVDDGLAFRVAFGAQPDPARFRLMLDTGQHHPREPNTGADHMIEGVNFYSYPAGASNWTWNIQAPPVIVAESNTLTYILLDAPPTSSGKWVAETTNPDWSPADRFPPIGEAAFRTSTLPELKLDVRHRPEDLSELTNGPPSLSCRFDDEIKSRQWVPSTSEPIWEIRSMRTSFPVRVVLYDVSSGQSAPARPVHTLQSGNTTRWDGTTLGIDWTLLAEPDENGDVSLTGQLHSETNRCLRVAVGCALNPTGWTWHDDMRFRRSITPSDDPYGNMTASACGVRGEQSLYPFGVISSDRGVLVVETDPDEPRVFQIFAETGTKFFGVYYDLALTPATAKFPGKATFRCSLRSLPPDDVDPFRRALAAFYQRHPAFWERRVPASGLWMPFYDISKLPDAEDFGFAFYEKGGERGTDVDYAKKHGILTLIYTEPWLYWLPMPASMQRSETNALHYMQLLAKLGDKQPNQFAAAALTGAVRAPDGSIRMKFMDVPWNSGARMEMSTDPDLPGPNRAMAEWRTISNALADARVDGVYLDSMQAANAADYNPAAIAVADYPCTFEMSELKPALSPRIAEQEFTAALGALLHARGKYLMANFPCWDWPFFMSAIDIPGEETAWFAGGNYRPLDDAKLNYRRAMSGQKPFGFLQAAKFDAFGPDIVERYFRDCMFWGFLPSFFSYDGANEPYWLNPKWYERDRPLFRKYIPLIRRLADAGWRPVGPVRAKDDALWVEHFGDRHITLRNTRSSVLTTELLGEGVLVNLLTAECQPLPCRVALAPGVVETCDVVPRSALNEEIEFLRSWKSPTGEAEACLRNLQALDTKLSYPMPAIRGEPNRLVIESPTGIVTQTFTEADLDTNGWLTVKTSAGARSFRPTFVGPLEIISGESRIVARGKTAAIDLSVLNRSSREWSVQVKWDGDFVAGQTNETISVGGLRAMTVPVTTTNELNRGYVTVAADAGGSELWRKKYFVLFVGENSSLTRDSRVKVIVDSTYPGYSTKVLRDGVTDTTGIAWNEAAWASDETGDAHWVKIVFPALTKVHEMAVYWNVEEGVTYTAQRGEVYGWTADDKKVLLGKFENGPPKPVTKVTFEPVELKVIQLLQPPQSGAKERPNLLWLAEVEVR